MTDELINLPEPEPGYQWVLVNREWRQVPETGKAVQIEPDRHYRDPNSESRFWLFFAVALMGIFLLSVITWVVRLLF